ncbi:MAG: spondin domain-containing protein [Pseudomonadota bacterium]
MTEIRVSVKNTSETGGVFLTPVYLGFHDGSFDLFDAGEVASPGLESLAEDGDAALLAGERLAADADSQGFLLFGAGGPVATGELTSDIFDIDGLSNGSLSLASMILPSNDAFIGTDEAVVLFDEFGAFLGAQTLVFNGTDVYDAGTEVNTELDAAFLNQLAPNTGVTENGVVTLHPGFNGSLGNPVGEGDQLIIGGTNAAGAAITEAADFTQPGAGIAEIHINTVLKTFGTNGNNRFFGGADDDFVEARGGSDLVFGGSGWDVLDGGNGNDTVVGGAGNDILSGGRGRDLIQGGAGDDQFYFAEGDGRDFVLDLNQEGDDQIVLAVSGVETFDDVLDVASASDRGVRLIFGEGDALFLRDADIDQLDAGDFLFA